MYLILLILWMILIFIMSSQTGSESSATSGFVITMLNYIGIDINSFLGQFTNLLIRKMAHLFEYFILAILFYNVLKHHVSNFLLYLLPVFFSFLYACTDEFHQTFVPMRSGNFIDVLIDTSGAIIAMILTLIFCKKMNATKNL